MEPAKAPTIEVVSCIPTSHGRLRRIGNGSRESPMKGVLAVAHPSWDRDVPREHLDEAVEILLGGLASVSQNISRSDEFGSVLQKCIHSCHLFVQEREFHMSSLLWFYDGSLMQLAGIGWTFGWHSKLGQLTQVLTPTSVTIDGAGTVLIASIGLGEIDGATNNAVIQSSNESRFCFTITSNKGNSHAGCPATNRFLNEFGPEHLPEAGRHQALCILGPGSRSAV